MLRQMFHPKRLIVCFVAFVCLVCIGSFAFFSLQEPPSPVVTYKTVAFEEEPKSNCASCGCGTKPDTEEVSNISENEVLTEPQTLVRDDTPSSVKIDNILAEPPQNQQVSKYVTEQEALSEVELAELEAQVESILGEEIIEFDAQLRQKYPLLSLSQSELLEFTQTPEGEREFWDQAKKYSDESLDYVAKQFALLPPERLDEALAYGMQWAMENGGDQIPTQYLQESMAEIKRRLNR